MMLDMTKDQRTIAQQREQIEELEETVLQLREELAGQKVGGAVSASAFPVEWKLTRGLSQILAALYNAPGGFVHKDRLQIAACVYRSPSEDESIQNLLKVQMVRLRRLLQPLSIEIKTIHGSGYALPVASKDIIKEALERRVQA